MTQTMTKEQTAVEFIIEMIDNMVLNGADLGEDLPPLLVHIKRAKEIEQQQLSAERERAGKLVEAAKRVLASWTERMNGESEQFVTSEVTDRSYWSPVASQVDSKEINNLKQTLNEYEKEITGNQDHTNPSSYP